jgi:hypothetical protein
MSPEDLMISRIRVADISDDEFEVGSLLVMNSVWISDSGTKASGRFPGVMELARQSDLGAYRVLAALEKLKHKDRLVRVKKGDVEEYWFMPLAPGWELWTQLNPIFDQVESPTYPPPSLSETQPPSWWMWPGGL